MSKASKPNTAKHFATMAIQSTEPKGDETGSVANSIYPTTTFKRELDGSYNSGYIYTRHDNPNRQLLEEALATLEGGETAFAFASGMAAISTMFQALKAGDHVILPDDAYYSVQAVAKDVFKRWELSHSIVDMTDYEAVQAAIRPETAMLWLESPSNPQLKISDITALSKLAKANGAITVVDNTWCTPVLQKPLNLGADVVMYSTTKYFGGHSDCLGGALVLGEPVSEELAPVLKNIQSLGGAVPAPFDCWLMTRGIKTLYLRLKQQSENATKLAKHLSTHEKVAMVHFPGLPTHPQYDLSMKQMPEGSGAMLSVQLGKSQAETMALIGKLNLFTAATSLGGVESLIEHRKSVEGDDSLTPDDLLRISVGIEHIDDLTADWDQALDKL
ncbi:trans-sulfuration enzyme family protein [Marinicella rhabdoformis]|uniref:trans-sulfuration enzyme family protein n=1 Tax=Marinicella rhabdoformis TaxID=2580566 RepID=UPI001C55355D|nr:aminotransferase class I/II-fold pyridoxal phosphate-dependent enzyme [Marinicella rhabdoformis]